MVPGHLQAQWWPQNGTRFYKKNSLYKWDVQCCPKMVSQSPNATHKRNGQPIIARRIIRFTTNEFLKCFSPTPFCICHIETGPLFTKLYVVRRLILRSLMSLELLKLRGCVLKYSNHFEIWQARLDSIAVEPPVEFPSDWSIWNINLTLFCFWLKKIAQCQITKLLFHCHFLPHQYIRTTQMLHGPPNDPAWMVHWATQDFRLWTALDVSLQQGHVIVETSYFTDRLLYGQLIVEACTICAKTMGWNDVQNLTKKCCLSPNKNPLVLNMKVKLC